VPTVHFAIVEAAVLDFIQKMRVQERLRHSPRFPGHPPRLDAPVNSEHWRRMHAYAAPELRRLGGPHSRRFRSAFLRQMVRQTGPEGSIHAVVDAHFKDLKPGFADLGRPVPENVIAVSLDSGRFHAATCRVPASSTLLVLVNSGACYLLYQMGKLVGYAFSQAEHKAKANPNEDGSYSIDFSLEGLHEFTVDDNQWMERFREAWKAYVMEGDVRYMKPWSDDAKFHQGFVAPLVFGAEKFLVGHELAHAVLGHLHGETNTAPLYGLEVDSYTTTHQEELDADRLAWEVIVRQTEKDDGAMFLPLGASLCIGVLAILEDLFHVTTFESHPPAANRSTELLKWYEAQPRSNVLPGPKGSVFLPPKFLTAASEILREAWLRSRSQIPRPQGN
jgi:hypothetical protein